MCVQILFGPCLEVRSNQTTTFEPLIISVNRSKSWWREITAVAFYNFRIDRNFVVASLPNNLSKLSLNKASELLKAGLVD